jgi:hypothetical protein
MYDITDMIDAGKAMPGSINDEIAKELRLEFERLTLEVISRNVVDGICYDDPTQREKWDDLEQSINVLSDKIARLNGDCLEALRAKVAALLYWFDYGTHGDVWRLLASPCRGDSTGTDVMLSMGDALCGDYKRALFDLKAKDAEKSRAAALDCARQQSASAKAA